MIISNFEKAEIERLFVSSFIVQERRERVLFELSSEKKRGHILDRMWWLPALENPLFISKNVIQLPKNIHHGSPEKFSAYLRQYNGYKAEKPCYVMSSAAEVDQKFMTLSEGVDAVENFGNTILVFTENLAFFKDEFYGKNILFRKLSSLGSNDGQRY